MLNFNKKYTQCEKIVGRKRPSNKVNSRPQGFIDELFQISKKELMPISPKPLQENRYMEHYQLALWDYHKFDTKIR